MRKRSSERARKKREAKRKRRLIKKNSEPPKFAYYIWKQRGERGYAIREYDYETWATWFQTEEQNVQLTPIKGLFEGVMIHTGYVGIASPTEENPKLFDTKVYHGPWDGLHRWYATPKEAIQDHRELEAWHYQTSLRKS